MLITRNRKYPNSQNYVIPDFEAFQEITLNYIGHSVHYTLGLKNTSDVFYLLLAS